MPHGKAKGIMFAVRLTEAQRTAVDAAAARAGKAVSEWARQALVMAAEASTKLPSSNL